MEPDHQQFCVEMMKRLNIQRKNGEFCDVVLKVAAGEGEMDVVEIKAHKLVLSSASPFFYNALKNDMREKQEGVIRLVEKRKALIELVVEYLYTGIVSITLDNVFDLIEASDYLMISSLKRLCETFLLDNITISNCICAYQCATTYLCQKLQHETRDFILANFLAVAQSEEFLNLSCDQVEEWISNDKIIVDGEEDVFGVILNWIRRDERSRSEYFCVLFGHVRCVFVTRDYLFRVILQNQFVQANISSLRLVLEALRWIAGGTDECFLKQTPRDCLKTYEDAIIACERNTSTLCFLPEEDCWYQLAPMTSARTSFTSSFCDGKLYVVGGSRDDGNVAERYDPSLNCWAAIQAPNQVNFHISIATFQGVVYAIGGKDSSERRSSIVQKYIPEVNQWQEVASLSRARSSVCAVATNHHLYAIGGLTDERVALDLAERFDLETNSWSTIAPVLGARNGASGVSYRGKLFLFGGVRSTRTYDMYDIALNQWSCIPCLPAPRHFGNVTNFKGQAFVFGDRVQAESVSMETSLQIFDMERHEWRFQRNDFLDNMSYKICTVRIPRTVLENAILL